MFSANFKYKRMPSTMTYPHLPILQPKLNNQDHSFACRQNRSSICTFGTFVFVILCFVCSIFVSPYGFAQEETQPYIKIGQAKTKKSLVAFPPLSYTAAPAANTSYQALGSELYNVINNDLIVSSYFQMIPQSAFLEDPSKTSLKPAPEDPKGFKFSNWAGIGAEFLIRGSFATAGTEISLEIYLYDVKKASLLLGKKYVGSTSTLRKVGHTFANDLIQVLTGSKGMFLSKIAVASDRGGGKFKEIYIMDWDSANPIRITDHKTISLSPAWSANGSKIAYTAIVQRAKTKLRNHDMFLYDVKSGSREMISFRTGINSGAAFAPDNKHLFLTISQGSAPDIYKLDYSGSIVAKVTNGPSGAMNVEPSIRSDGKKIAFSSDRSGRPMIYTMNIDGTDPQRITFAGQFNASPAWSPDGKKIAFAGYESDHFDIFVMNADGTEMIRLTKATKPNGRAANNEDPCFSPDGRFVIYTSDRSGKNQIYISTVDGAEERRVTNDRANYFKARWSPNLE